MHVLQMVLPKAGLQRLGAGWDRTPTNIARLLCSACLPRLRSQARCCSTCRPQQASCAPCSLAESTGALTTSPYTQQAFSCLHCAPAELIVQARGFVMLEEIHKVRTLPGKPSSTLNMWRYPASIAGHLMTPLYVTSPSTELYSSASPRKGVGKGMLSGLLHLRKCSAPGCCPSQPEGKARWLALRKQRCQGS